MLVYLVMYDSGSYAPPYLLDSGKVSGIEIWGAGGIAKGVASRNTTPT